MDTLMLHQGATKLGRQDLLALPTPDGTDTHTTIPHAKVVESALEALAYRRIDVVKEEYGVSKDAMRMFGVLTLSVGEGGDRADRVNLVLGLRNSHDKSFALGMVAGFRVFVCDNLAFKGEFFAIARRHSRRLLDGFTDTVSIGVDRVQRHFQPMQEQVNVWRNHELADIQARDVIYRAFIAGKLDAPKHLATVVHDHYFAPKQPEFEPRTVWSLQNAFTSAFKSLDPLPQYRATASLGEFFTAIG
jgi:hypothetical protein